MRSSTLWPDHLGKKPWRRSHSRSVYSGRLREYIADFKVTEQLDFEFADEGEHLYLQVEKTGMTSTQVAQLLAEHYGVSVADVAYSGMKDKRAIATQWFSVRLPQKEARPNVPFLRILQERRHTKKLRRGQHRANRFELVVRGVQHELDSDIARRLRTPFPNYFGPQRFGYQGSNWQRAREWAVASRPRVGRATRAIYLSTLRAGIFNDLLALRIENDTWNVLVDGDVSLDCVPTGPMWGRGSLPTSVQALKYEQEIQRMHAPVCEALEWVGLKHDRRKLAVAPNEVVVHLENNSIFVGFVLPPSAYANVFLNEHFELMECHS